MFKFVNQSSATLVAAVCARTHHLPLLSAPCLQGRGTEVARHSSASAALSVHSCSKRQAAGPGKSIGGAAEEWASALSSTHFLSNATYFRNNQVLLSCSERLVWGTRHQYKEFSSSSSSTSSTEPGITEKELKREIDDLTDKFMETRELLEDAMESKDTVYFNDDLKDAKEAVQETLSQFEDLMAKLSEEQERNVRRTIGLKMEELRAQEMMIDDSLKE
ncbi:uncharacterized protein LOC105437211 [Strongylocentrotus purpuratus]|uniref:Uncharacterized protein n=1 Tax=Strongylocentrotus purpuratus TaxID=7668 RepID=A0A7M7HEL0_STRPU|nr:uncharacterized protein LOC105437211 [Strongylocentrotus purpuratus]|eukprot:XP_011661834.1 PREDICTED: uncharacterized protein LOC105437211 [Strongylocentrotus purpuratus]